MTFPMATQLEYGLEGAPPLPIPGPPLGHREFGEPKSGSPSFGLFVHFKFPAALVGKEVSKTLALLPGVNPAAVLAVA